MKKNLLFFILIGFIPFGLCEANTVLPTIKQIDNKLSIPDGFQKDSSFEISVISEEQALNLMIEYKNSKDLFLDLGLAGTYPRIQVMADIAAQRNIRVAKVFLKYSIHFEEGLRPKLQPHDFDNSDHAAIAVYVKSKSQNANLVVIDPLISNTPLSLVEYKNKIKIMGKLDDLQSLNPIYFGSTSQYFNYSKYPAKIPDGLNTDMTRFSREQLLKTNQYFEWRAEENHSDDEYCDVIGINCKSEEKLLIYENKNKLKEEFEKSFYNTCENDDDIKQLSETEALVPDGFSKGYIKVSIITKEQLFNLFNSFKENKKIIFDAYLGCEFRALVMIDIAQKKNFNLGKLFVEGALDAKNKFISKKRVPYFSWEGHVAPFAIFKDKNNKLKKMILDPSLFDTPVDYKKFIKAVTIQEDGSSKESNISRSYCSDQYQMTFKFVLDIKFPPHDMSQIIKEAYSTMEGYKN